MKKDEVQLWLRDPTTKWFMWNLGQFRENVQDWRTANDIVQVARLQGIAAILERIDGILADPSSYD